MRIDTVRIDSYRGIDSLDIPLDPWLTVLFGPNGCGKSSVLTAIAMALSKDEDAGEFKRLDLDRRREAAGRLTLQLDLSPAFEPSPSDGKVRVTRYADSKDGLWRREVEPRATLPLCVPFEPGRGVVDSLRGREVGSRPDLNWFFDWFYVEEGKELRAKRDRGIEELPTVSAVRRAICAMLDAGDSSYSNPRIVHDEGPPRLTLTVDDGYARSDRAFEQLSDGYQGVIAVAAEIARRLSGLETSTDDPLAGEMIVLIDEVESHLHPSWQQRVIPDLVRTFPNVQFVVSTHSPQVLTTVRPEHVVELAVEDGRVVAGGSPGPTYGAAAGDVLAGLMGVERRPSNEFTRLLRTYRRLIGRDLGETDEAVALRARLDELSHQDPALADADMEIRHRKLVRKRKE